MSLRCNICNTQTSSRCSICKSSSYCSRECQQTDWPLHKLLCKSFQALPPRPTPDSVRAILFPVDAKVPQLLWVTCERVLSDEDGRPWDRPKIEHLFGHDPFLQWIPIKENICRNFDLDHTTNVVCRETFLVDGSSPNQSVIAATRNRLIHDWRGPLMVLSQPGLAVDPRFYQDVTLQDFRHTVDYLSTYGIEFAFRPDIKGVKIICEGDTQFFESEPFVEAGVPQDHSAENDEGHHGTGFLGGICRIL